MMGHCDTVKILLDYRANINAAVNDGEVDVVILLLEKMADIEAKDNVSQRYASISIPLLTLLCIL
jgi:hypothetical protein